MSRDYCDRTTLKDFFRQPDPPVISREAYIGAPQVQAGILGAEVTMPAAGQNAVPQPQQLYNLGSFKTPFRWLWRRPKNVLRGP